MTQAIYIASIVISLTILFVAYLNYRRKSGVYVRGSYSMASSKHCDDRYVSEVILENQKDRIIILFGVYLQIGHAYLIEIEDFEENPFHLKPYGSFHKGYGPIEHYDVSLYKVDFNELLEEKKVRKRLVLSTSEGKYVVRKPIRRWHPIADFFRNHLAAVARPVQSKYKETYLGSRIKYVVEFSTQDGKEEIVPIHPDDYGIKKFRSFSLTKESLQSRDALDSFLQDLLNRGVINCSSVVVHDVDEWRNRRERESLPRKSVKARHYNAFMFFVIGPIYTWYSNWKLRLKNRIRKLRAS